MNGKYVVTTKAYNKLYGMVEVRKVFKGDKAEAYTNAMTYAFNKANAYKDKGVDFSVTVKGENWRTASSVRPM